MLRIYTTSITSVLTCSIMMKSFLRLNTPIERGDPARISYGGPAKDLVGVSDVVDILRVSIWGRDMEYSISTG